MAEFNNLLDQKLIMKRRDLTSTEKWVAVVLLSFRNAIDGRCDPPIESEDTTAETVCTQSGFSRPCIKKAIDNLKAKGIISVVSKTARPSQINFLLTRNGITRNEVTGNEVTRNDVTPYPKRGYSLPVTTLPQTNKEQINNKESKKENNKEKSFDEGLDDVPELFPETTYELSPVETEEKTKSKRVTKKSLIRPSDCSEQVFSDWVDFKRKVSKSITQYMVNAIAREAKKASITTEQAMIWQMEKGYQGFSAEWYLNKSTKQQKQSEQKRELTPDDFSDNQIGFFASKLVRNQSFISEFGIGQTDYGVFASKVVANFRNPRFFPRYVTYLQKLGLIRH